ncbi:hypothetical protein L195_g036570 [Trifolium pratense]|uniref:Uncharacterized protein n=1 Tax=Trifolium pratense TaxID=57577 RepID=A0A2K3LPV5_TRIPR|nr:hypothetical protein L195_g036570 [Trifolium pratense]
MVLQQIYAYHRSVGWSIAWFFNKYMLIIGPMGRGDEPKHVPLYRVPFWVQVHNLPTRYMSKTVGQNVGNYIYEFLEYDDKNSSNFWRRLYSVEDDDDIREWGPELRLEVRRRGQETSRERDTGINEAITEKKQNGPQLKTDGADIIESSNRHDLMDAFINKNPALIGRPIKTRVKQPTTDKNQITTDTSNHYSINMDEDIIVPKKKRMRNGNDKEETILEGVKANNEAINNMHVDIIVQRDYSFAELLRLEKLA